MVIITTKEQKEARLWRGGGRGSGCQRASLLGHQLQESLPRRTHFTDDNSEVRVWMSRIGTQHTQPPGLDSAWPSPLLTCGSPLLPGPSAPPATL